MDPPLCIPAVTQFQSLFGSKSKVQDDLNEEKKDGRSNPGEQLAVGTTEAEACNVAPEQYGKTSPGSNPPAEKSGNRKRRRKVVTIKPEQQLGESKAVSPSPRQLEEATNQAGHTEEVKFEKQLAMSLLIFSAGAVISAKGTAFTHQAGQLPAAGGQKKHQQGFFFWASIAIWFTSLLFSMFAVLLTTSKQRTPGLVMYAKIINYFSICLTVLGVAFWILS